MISISNTSYNILVDKLPTLIELATSGSKPHTLRQINDIRQLSQLHKLLKRKLTKQTTNQTNKQQTPKTQTT